VLVGYRIRNDRNEIWVEFVERVAADSPDLDDDNPLTGPITWSKN
jgi:hypothetical protein